MSRSPSAESFRDLSSEPVVSVALQEQAEDEAEAEETNLEDKLIKAFTPLAADSEKSMSDWCKRLVRRNGPGQGLFSIRELLKNRKQHHIVGRTLDALTVLEKELTDLRIWYGEPDPKNEKVY